MPLKHRRIPVLPESPRAHPIAGHVTRSYNTGRQNFGRACQGAPLVLTISSTDPLPPNVQATLLTSINTTRRHTWNEIPFVRADERTLICTVVPERTGLNSFRAEFSLDEGATWLRDTVPDAWILIDPPQVDGLRLYSVIPTVSGTIADWEADLKRIRDMGFNAIHLLPVTTQDASQSPYSAKDLFAVDPSYLMEGRGKDGLSQLEEYIESAQAIGMRLCFDLVLNHVGVTSTMAVKAPDWIVPDETQPDGLQRARYLTDQGWRTWEDLVLINYEHPSEEIRSAIWAYMTDYALFWAKYANDTGGLVRFDNLHGSDHDFIRALTRTLHSNYPEVGLLAEYFTDDRTMLNTGEEWGLNLLLATPWERKFVPQLRDYLKYIHRVAGQIRYLMPITSHDSGSPAQEFGTAESTVPRYVAAALLGTGATGIPQGVEFGEAKRVEFIGRQPRMTYPEQAMFAPFLTRVNTILAEFPAFRLGGNCEFVDEAHPAIIAAFRRDPSPDAYGFLVACNFDTVERQRIEIDISPFVDTDGPVECSELISFETQTLPSAHLMLDLPPCSARVLMFPRSMEPNTEATAT
jgi:hypothetical protein